MRVDSVDRSVVLSDLRAENRDAPGDDRGVVLAGDRDLFLDLVLRVGRHLA
jgi:hypothetical protein